MNNRLAGSFVALITPFNADGTIDFGAFRSLVAFHEENGTPALFFLGTAGEKSALSEKEYIDIVEKTGRIPRKNMQFFYGATGHSTASTCANLKRLADSGADGAVVTVPPYLGPSQDEAQAYFLTVAEAAPLPLGLYNNPDRLLIDLTPETLAPVFAHERVIAYKEGSGQTGKAAQLLKLAGDVAIMAADTIDPDIITPIMALGGAGICNAFGNIAPQEAVRLATPWTDTGAGEAYRQAFMELHELLQFAYSLRSPIAVKALMNEIGLPAGAPRAPLSAADASVAKRGRTILERMGYFDRYATPTLTSRLEWRVLDG